MPRGWVVALILICTALNGAGFLWHLFEPIPGYDEIAHFLTPFTLVAITAEIIYRGGGDDEFFNTPRRAVITGSDRKSTRLNSSHANISYAVFCLKKKNNHSH